jgi:Zn-finger nucleic acid-binding protein
MQAYFVEGDVELDRCLQCMRLWFDVKELEKSAGRSFLPRLKGTDSSHECPVDKVLLGTSLIRGDVAIEECPMCGGALLDAHDFELIAGKALKEAVKPKPKPKRAAPPPPAPKVVAFRCERCGDKTPISQAGNTLGQTVCRDCELKPWPQPTQPYQTTDIGKMIEEMLDTLFD